MQNMPSVAMQLTCAKHSVTADNLKLTLFHKCKVVPWSHRISGHVGCGTSDLLLEVDPPP